MTKKEYIEKNFDLDTLYKIGFIKTRTNYDEIERRILTFFEIKRLEDYFHIGETTTPLQAKNIFSLN